MTGRTGVVQHIEPVVVAAEPLPLRHQPLAGQELLRLHLGRQVLGETEVLVG